LMNSSPSFGCALLPARAGSSTDDPTSELDRRRPSRKLAAGPSHRSNECGGPRMIRGNGHAGINRVIGIGETGRVARKLLPNARCERRTSASSELVKVRTLEFRDE